MEIDPSGHFFFTFPPALLHALWLLSSRGRRLKCISVAQQVKTLETNLGLGKVGEGGAMTQIQDPAQGFPVGPQAQSCQICYVRVCVCFQDSLFSSQFYIESTDFRILAANSIF